MKQNPDYNIGLPDFLEMQRISFCWFLAEGLREELAMFSRIDDFTHSIEHILFGDEHSIVKPPCNLVTARKYNGNYRVQLIIPMEVRNKKLNTTIYYRSFPIINLPLMTTASTFLLNGCERVIVSQIIRSPGIYFERNKNQKKKSGFKRKFSTDISRLRSFLPSGETFLSELDLFFAIPQEKTDTLSRWKSESISRYSFKFITNKEKEIYFHFLQCFKLYRVISKQINNFSKSSFIKLFCKWVISKKYFKSTYFDVKQQKLVYLIEYFNTLSKSLIKYKFLQKNLTHMDQIYDEISFLITKLINKNNLTQLSFSDSQRIELLGKYEKILINSQKFAQIKLNSQILMAINKPIDWILEVHNFSFLKRNLTKFNKKINQKIDFHLVKPTLYFSTTLKDELKYFFGDWRNPLTHHPYLKSKSHLILYREDHDINTKYHTKYDEKELYTAILIPDYGSWIRFSFKQNTKLNFYNYPIKNQEDDIIIQLDKIQQKPILELLKEMGLTDLEIYQNLYNADFFYFDQPLLLKTNLKNQPILRFDLDKNYFNNISEFSRIFDGTYYRLGKVGRLKINSRLNMNLDQQLQTITYEDIFAIIDKLITITISKHLPDDIDHLKNRRVRSIGELLQSLFRSGFQRLVRHLRNQTNKVEAYNLLNFTLVNGIIREFFTSSQLSQYLDQTNPLSSLTHRRRISGLGPGGFDRDRISFSVRDIHPSHYGRICPIETPEGQNVGLIASLTTCARVNKLGFLETPFWRVINGKVLKIGNPIYLTADIEDLYKIAPADISINSSNYLDRNVISVRYNQDFINVMPSEVDFIAISTVQVVSIAASLIPFFEHDDANRALMGSNMQRQSVPLLSPQKPIIGTGLENQIAMDSGMTINAKKPGQVFSVTADKICIQDTEGQKTTYTLNKYLRSNQQTCINHRPIVWEGERVESGQILTDGPAIVRNELALGQNVLVAYMPWQGYNFEDAILINERLVYEDVFTSIHIERYRIEIDKTSDIPERSTKNIPNLNNSDTKDLNDDGIVAIGTFVKPGDILVGKVIANDNSDQLPESKLLRAIFGTKSKGIKDNSFRLPEGDYGRIIETLTFNRRIKLIYEFEKIHIFIAQVRKIQVGDKIAGRHGNKGIVSRILPRQDMPFLPDGTPIDIILNPLGVPSRMNVGQLYECLLGLAGDKLNCRFKILPFDEMYGNEMSRILINKKLRHASIVNNESWLFNPYSPGKMVLIDGRNGKEFENPITVGNAYMLKLIHLVDDKMHARATGPYSLITQQPLRGKSQHGGQRFGEMEVWALEGFGAAFTLQELLTIKSDDMQGRNETLNAIVKGKKIPQYGIPESFKVLLQELRSIGLDISTYRIEKFSFSKDYEAEVNLLENYDPFSKTFSPTSNTNDILF